MEKELRVIISGGGTGGHIFPAVSIANAVKALRPNAKILFVGALGRMEMQRVPAAGYEIKGLPICGFDRKNLLKNLKVLYKIWKSQRMAKQIIKDFKPQVAVGVGGYASGPTLNKAAAMGIPCLIQEQNSYAGVTNKLLAKKAAKICVAYEGMERFFPAEKIILTGNPVRQALLDTPIKREEAIKTFGLNPAKKTILLVGGSLGARTINESVLQHLDLVKSTEVQFIWQTGKYYSAEIAKRLEGQDIPNLVVTDFITDMGAAYKAADLVISRAGASSISEFCLIGKPVILVPSPNVAEDHQTKNALALANRDAAIYVKDAEAPATLLELAIKTRLCRYYRQRSYQVSKMNINDIKSVYFVGAGGIGMSAIARYFLNKGLVVGGYDKTPSDLTRQLEKEGMLIHYEEDINQIPQACKNTQECLVIYTPAIPAEHQELCYFQENGFEIQKRAQVLGTLTKTHKGLCVAGTHGKTTTSTMCAHIMHQSHLDCNAFLGGISKNYGTNYILSDSDFVVIEADEFDRSFHWLRPWMSVITSTDPDHLDIYGTKEAYLESFRHYSELIQPGGALIIHRGLEMKENIQSGVRHYDYSLNEGDFHAENIRIENGEITFDFISPIESIKDVNLGQPIPINIENGIAAMAMAQLNGCTAEELKRGMQTYGGVDRRFDFKIKTDKLVFLSDYAHHPKEIYQSARSIRELYKDKHITAIFQPHLYTRTRDFYKDFADALSQLDEVILTEIYPARELPIEGVTSKLIYDNLKPGVKKEMIQKADVLNFVKNHSFEVLIVLGAGDLDNQVPEIAKLLNSK